MLKRFTWIGVAAGLLGARMAEGQSVRSGWGATPYADGAGTGTTFRVWAPNATKITVAGDFNGWNTNSIPLVKESPASNGIWSVDVPAARAGHSFIYSINDAARRRDPRSRRVVHSGAAGSVIYDPAAYAWSTPEFIAPPIEDLVVYEMHIGTFNHPNPTEAEVGTFTQAIERLDDVALLGANAIQLMPVAEFAGNTSWGYNPADPYAVESAYGGPDGFKAFVDACHARGLAVLLDVVHNHYGPGDLANSLWAFDGWAGAQGGGIYFYQDAARAMTPWGPRPDYSRPQVREYIRDNIRMWLDEYRVDGFRWDATLFIRRTTNFAVIADGELLLREIGDMMAMEYPEKIHIAEDLLGADYVTGPLTDADGLGFHSQWERSFHETVTAQLTNDAGRNLETIAGRIAYTNGTRRVIYTESHDEVGYLNEAEGARRFTTEIAPADPFGRIARKKSTLGAALALTAPGVPMLFQGQEMLENEIFSTTNAMDWSKTNTYSGIVRLYQDLIGARRNRGGVTAGLQGRLCATSVTNNDTLLLIHRGLEGRPDDDVYVIANVSSNYVEGYWIDFPADGTWHVHVNSDHSDYSPDFQGWGSTNVFVWPDRRGNPYVAPWSVLILSRQAPAPADGDRDGLPDAWETANGLDPADPRDAWLNPDADAYTHLQEYRAGTDTRVWNRPASSYTQLAVAGDLNGWSTSADGMALIADGLWQRDLALANPVIQFKFAADDGWAVNWGAEAPDRGLPPLTWPATPSGPNIVLSNLAAGLYRFRFDEQRVRFTVRTVARADSDNDGVPDEWEIDRGLNPIGSQDALANPDGDLYTNLEEYRFGKDPWVWDAPLTEYTGMGVIGDFNGWNEALMNMRQDTNAHYTWLLVTNLVRRAGVRFKFAADGAWTDDWGESDQPHTDWPLAGVAEYKAGDIVIAKGLNGRYRFTFNERTRAYSVVLDDPDADVDGLPDWWEILHFGGPTAADPAGNPDEDVYTNEEEYLNNTDPNVWTAPASTYASMAVAGTFNGWNTASNMSLVNHYTWRFVRTFTNASNVEFKFAANGGWTHNWGHNQQAPLPLGGTAQASGPNIRISGVVDGEVVFLFNDQTRAYSAAYTHPPAVLRLEPGAAGHAGGFVLQWNSEPGMLYHLQRSVNLLEGFQMAAPSIAPTPPVNVYTDAVDHATAFYRLLIED